jgi:hypothetical protein
MIQYIYISNDIILPNEWDERKYTRLIANLRFPYKKTGLYFLVGVLCKKVNTDR